MTDTIQKSEITCDQNDQALREDLERRYGPAMAQEIMDQLKKAESIKKRANISADYMAVKALSEGVEIYRRESQTVLMRLKTSRMRKAVSLDNIIEFDGAFLQREFERTFSFYLRFHRGYHALYRQVMEAYRVKAYVPHNVTITSMAA